jgi:hypothetical protein
LRKAVKVDRIEMAVELIAILAAKRHGYAEQAAALMLEAAPEGVAPFKRLQAKVEAYNEAIDLIEEWGQQPPQADKEPT